MISYNKNEIYAILKNQLAIEFNCKAEDFDKEENIITLPSLHPNRRKFSDKEFFLQMATLGGNTVISANEKLHLWLIQWVKDKRGFWLFEQHNFFELENELRKYGYKMSLTHHMFLPKPVQMEIKSNLKIKWLEQADIKNFYGDPRFPNAICDKFKPERPDILAIVALDENASDEKGGAKIMGMAGCSIDAATNEDTGAPALWQIGIDVMPEYRGHKIGTTLVTLLRNETFRRGALPYYGTSLSNLASWKIALASGFEPAWVECEAREYGALRGYPPLEGVAENA